MLEQWIRWEPVLGLSEKYYIESVSDNIEGFKVVLFDAKDRKKKVIIIFEDGIDSYKRTDESYRLKIIYDLKETYGRNFYGDWTFFKVNNSSYIKWLSEQSYEISDERSFEHFSFLAADSVLDIITNYEPKIEFVD